MLGFCSPKPCYFNRVHSELRKDNVLLETARDSSRRFAAARIRLDLDRLFEVLAALAVIVIEPQIAPAKVSIMSVGDHVEKK